MLGRPPYALSTRDEISGPCRGPCASQDLLGPRLLVPLCEPSSSLTLLSLHAGLFLLPAQPLPIPPALPVRFPNLFFCSRSAAPSLLHARPAPRSRPDPWRPREEIHLDTSVELCFFPWSELSRCPDEHTHTLASTLRNSSSSPAPMVGGQSLANKFMRIEELGVTWSNTQPAAAATQLCQPWVPPARLLAGLETNQCPKTKNASHKGLQEILTLQGPCLIQPSSQDI